MVPLNSNDFSQRKSGYCFQKEGEPNAGPINQLFTRDAVPVLDEMATSHVYQLMPDQSELTSGLRNLIAHF